MRSLRFFDTADGSRYHLMHDAADDSRAIVDWETKPVLRISSSLVITAPCGNRVGAILALGEHWLLETAGERYQLSGLHGFDPTHLELAEVEAAKILLKQKAETPISAMTPEQLQERQKALEGEIQANEDENRMLQAELDQIYAEQDRRRN